MAEEPSGNFNLIFEEEEDEEEDEHMPIIEPTKRPSTVYQPQSSYQLSTPTSIDYNTPVRIRFIFFFACIYVLIYYLFRRIELRLITIAHLLRP